MICISKPRICTTEKRYPKFCTPEPRICTTDSVVQKKTGLQILGFTDIQGFHTISYRFLRFIHPKIEHVQLFTKRIQKLYFAQVGKNRHTFVGRKTSIGYHCSSHTIRALISVNPRICNPVFSVLQNLYYRFWVLGYRIWDISFQ